MSRPTLLITGAAGFLGQAIVRELCRDNAVLDPREVRLFDVRTPPAGPDERFVSVPGDVTSASDIARAVDGVDLVIHAAAIIDWGHHSPQHVRAVNLDATTALLGASRAAGARGFVFTSTEDVVYTGRPITDGDESLPYATRAATAYIDTKIAAERAVLAFDQPDGLRTTAIRPTGIFGERDPYHTSSLVRMADRKMFTKIGDGTARCNHVYVGNVAHAHLLAAAALWRGDSAVAGRAYFIIDSPPRNFFDFLSPILEGLGYRIPPWSRALPRPLMLGVGAALEAAAWAVRPVLRINPPVSRFAVTYVSQDFTFTGRRAAEELGYTPVYSEQEAIARTIADFAAHGPV